MIRVEHSGAGVNEKHVDDLTVTDDDRSEKYVYDDLHLALVFEDTGLTDDLTHRYLHGPAIDQVLAEENVATDVAATHVTLESGAANRLNSPVFVATAGGRFRKVGPRRGFREDHDG